MLLRMANTKRFGLLAMDQHDIGMVSTADVGGLALPTLASLDLTKKGQLSDSTPQDISLHCACEQN